MLINQLIFFFYSWTCGTSQFFSDDCSESCSTKLNGCDADAKPEQANQKVWNKKDT